MSEPGQYLDGRPSLHGPLGQTTFTAWTTWMDNLHCLDYFEGRPSLHEVVRWTTFAAWNTWMEDLHYWDIQGCANSPPQR
eukprot:12076890-Karenia_brevis.AAC.1